MLTLLRKTYTAIIFAICLGILTALAVFIRCLRVTHKFPQHPRLIFAGKPISGLLSTAQALRDQGYDVLTITNAENFIKEGDRFDKSLFPKPDSIFGLGTLLFAIQHIRLFWQTARHYDVLHGYFNGAIFGAGPLSTKEYGLWKLSGRKLILMPYGSDAFVYSKMPDTTWAKTIQETYPHTEKEDLEISARLSDFSKKADAIVGCLIHYVNLPHVTINPLLWYPMESLGEASLPKLKGVIKIVHAPNHRLIKGTDILIRAVQKLQKKGVNIDLNIIEGQPRDVVIQALKEADIVVDQIHAGYALHALEGMSLGKIVVTGINLKEPVYEPHMSQLESCPLYFCSEATIYTDLEKIIADRKNWHKRSKAIREYGNKHHSPDVTAMRFMQLYDSFR